MLIKEKARRKIEANYRWGSIVVFMKLRNHLLKSFGSPDIDVRNLKRIKNGILYMAGVYSPYSLAESKP
jgi:hypothetical protein